MMDFKVKFGIVIGISVLIPAAFFLVFLRPQLSSISQLRKDIDHYKAKAKESEATVASVQNVHQETMTAERELDRLRERLPEKRERSRLLKTLSDELGRQGIYVVSLKPQTEVPMDTPTSRAILRMGIELKVDCSLMKLGEFLGALEGFSEIIIVKDFLLKKKKKGGERLDVTVVLEAFLLG